ncbi:MAG: hypothetical protein MJA82_06740 [Clostridia bacterium]|nr:hypothetical protein [Clostridia bacterium]
MERLKNIRSKLRIITIVSIGVLLTIGFVYIIASSYDERYAYYFKQGFDIGIPIFKITLPLFLIIHIIILIVLSLKKTKR